MKTFESPSGQTTVKRILMEEKYYAPNVSIELPALLKMKGYVEKHDKEIAWLGIVERIDENKFVIKDVDIIKQEVSNVTADLHESGLQAYAEQLINEGQIDDLEKVRVWGHSHVNMDVFPSSQDEETFKEYYLNCNYFIRIIANKKGKLKLDIVLLDKELRFDNVKWDIIYPDEIVTAIEKKIALEKEANEIGKNVESFIDTLYKSYEENIKKEIERNVKDEKPYGNVRRFNEYGYGYGWDDDDYDDPYLNTERHFKQMKEDFPKITLFANTESEMQVSIDEYFDDSDVVFYYKNCDSSVDLASYLDTESEFYFNTTKDWSDLYTKLIRYYHMLYTA